jgi:hypothetical protein
MCWRAVRFIYSRNSKGLYQEGTDTQQLEYDLGVKAGMAHPFNPHVRERVRSFCA